VVRVRNQTKVTFNETVKTIPNKMTDQEIHQRVNQIILTRDARVWYCLSHMNLSKITYIRTLFVPKGLFTIKINLINDV